MNTPKIKETDLYSPVKSMLEKQGYTVKGEIGAADIVAVREDEVPVIVELKTAFSLSLFHQAVQRQSISDLVYIAVPKKTGAIFQRALKNNKSLCRRLGIGLITVRLSDQFIETHIDPAPYRPRQNAKRKQLLLKEFHRRVGDPNKGGASRVGLITAYRQDSLKCLLQLSIAGPSKASLVATETQTLKARNIMADDHYGWFEKIERGIYGLTINGHKALKDYAKEIKELKLNLK